MDLWEVGCVEFETTWSEGENWGWLSVCGIWIGLIGRWWTLTQLELLLLVIDGFVRI